MECDKITANWPCSKCRVEVENQKFFPQVAFTVAFVKLREILLWRRNWGGDMELLKLNCRQNS